MLSFLGTGEESGVRTPPWRLIGSSSLGLLIAESFGFLSAMPPESIGPLSYLPPYEDRKCRERFVLLFVRESATDCLVRSCGRFSGWKLCKKICVLGCFSMNSQTLASGAISSSAFAYSSFSSTCSYERTSGQLGVDLSAVSPPCLIAVRKSSTRWYT